MKGWEIMQSIIKIEGDQREKAAIVFVHGSGCNKNIFVDIAERIENYTKIALDLTGHDDNYTKAPMSFEQYIQDVKEVIKDYDKVILVGHSLGGAVVLAVAAEGLANVTGVVGLDTGAKFATAEEAFGIKEGEIPDLNLLEKALGNEGNIEIKEAMAEMESVDVMLTDLNIGQNVDIREDMQNIKCPVALIVGSNDTIAPVQLCRDLKSSIPECDYQVIPGCGHMMPVLVPDVVAKIIADFTYSLV